MGKDFLVRLAISGWCALAVIIILWGIRFDNIDDMTFSLSNYDFWIGAAEAQGRIKMYASGPLAMLPYSFNSAASISIFRTIGWLCLVFSLAWYLSVLARNYFVGPVVVGITSLLWSNSVGGHNMLVSYPFYVPVIASLFILSLSAYTIESKRNKWSLHVMSSLLLFVTISLGGELYFPYVVIMALYGVFGFFLSKNRVLFLKSHILILIALAIPLAASVFYRVLHPSSYDGNSGVNFDLESFLATLVTLSGGLFPGVQAMKNLHYLVQDTSQVVSVIALSLSLFLLLAISRSNLADGLENKRVVNYVVSVMPLFLLGVFAPNTLISLTSKYQSWVESGVTDYLYSSLSFVAMVAIATILLVVFSRVRFVYYAYIVVLSVCAGLTQANNFYVADHQRAKAEKWDFIESAIDKISSGTPVVDLNISLSGDFYELMPTEDYWDRYAMVVLNKKYTFTRFAGEGYFIERLSQASDNGFLVVGFGSDVTHVLSRNYCDQLEVCFVITNKISVNGFLESGRKNGAVKIKLLAPEYRNGIYVYTLDAPLKKQALLGISQQRYEGAVSRSDMSIVFSQGVDGLEVGKSAQWRWARTPVKIDIDYNAQEKSLIRVTVCPAADMSLSAKIGGKTKVFQVKKDVSQDLLIDAVLNVGGTELSIESDVAPIKLNPLDPRYFSFQITGFDIQVSKIQ